MLTITNLLPVSAFIAVELDVSISKGVRTVRAFADEEGPQLLLLLASRDNVS